MSLSKCGIVSCPCCNQESLQPNGAFYRCASCGLAITTQALTKAIEYTHASATFDDAIVTSLN